MAAAPSPLSGPYGSTSGPMPSPRAAVSVCRPQTIHFPAEGERAAHALSRFQAWSYGQHSTSFSRGVLIVCYAVARIFGCNWNVALDRLQTGHQNSLKYRNIQQRIANLSRRDEGWGSGAQVPPESALDRELTALHGALIIGEQEGKSYFCTLIVGDPPAASAGAVTPTTEAWVEGDVRASKASSDGSSGSDTIVAAPARPPTRGRSAFRAWGGRRGNSAPNGRRAMTRSDQRIAEAVNRAGAASALADDSRDSQRD